MIFLGIVVAFAAGAATFVFLTGDDDGGEEVVLEPIGTEQENAFIGNLDLGLAEDAEATTAQIEEGLQRVPDLTGGVEEVAASLSGLEVSGGEPGLYGGSREDGVCNFDELISFLTDEANADKAEAWASVLGISTEEIPDYIDTLTPVRLRADTRVTNHGFESGEATPFQSVLQAGTAVLVDNTGVPRVKCNCGNPLAEPEPQDAGEVGEIDSVAQNPEDAWENLDPAQVVTVAPAEEELSDLTIVDFETGGQLERPVGSKGDDDRGTGDFQATLEWNGNADLDLHVTEPGGTEISYNNKQPQGPDWGQLDRDANIGCPDDANSGVENVFWPQGDAPPGEYLVEVNGFSVEGCTGNDYTLTISVFGREDEVHEGTVGQDETDSYPVTVEE